MLECLYITDHSEGKKGTALEEGLEGVLRELGREEGRQQQHGRAPEPEGLEEVMYIVFYLGF